MLRINGPWITNFTNGFKYLTKNQSNGQNIIKKNINIKLHL